MSRPAYQRWPMIPMLDVEEPPRRKARISINLPQALCQAYGKIVVAKDPPQVATIQEVVVYELPPLATRGRGFLYDFRPQGGPVVYSPNCNRPDLRVPASKPDSHSGSTLQGRDYDLEAFKQPQYWSRAQGYFAFLPRTATNTSFPSLSSLRALPYAVQVADTRHFKPGGGRWRDWLNLQANVVNASRMLIQCAGLPTAYPATPCAHLSSWNYDSEAALEEGLEKTRDWFAVWFGILAYAVAALGAMHAKVEELNIPRFVPAWMDILRNPQSEDEQPLDEVFVSDMSQAVSPTDKSIARVGTFVCIPDHLDPEMVSVDWLISLDIPVFWEWTHREEAIAKEHPFFTRFCPPEDAHRVFGAYPGAGVSLQFSSLPVASGEQQRPSSPPIASLQSVDFQAHVVQPPLPAVADAHDPSLVSPPVLPLPPQSPSRSKFLQRAYPSDSQLVEWNRVASVRDDRRKARIASETAVERNLRIAKEANPPTRHNKVTFWIWSPDSAGVYMAERADKETAQEMFFSESGYSKDQAIFDYFTSTWHAADFLGRPTDAQLDYEASCAADYHNTPYELELKILRVWYRLDDLPDETPAQMKARLVGLKSTSDAKPGTPTQRSTSQAGAGDVVMDLAEDAAGDDRDTPQNGARDAPEWGAYLLGGYLVPDGLDPSSLASPSTRAKGIICYLLGQRVLRIVTPSSPYWETPTGKALGSFGETLSDATVFHDLSINGPASLPNHWDLQPSSRFPVQRTSRFENMERVEGKFTEEVVKWDNVEGVVASTARRATRIFLFGGLSSRGWRLGCTSPSVALHICRLDAPMTLMDLARDLLGRGFRICTFAPVASSPRALSTPTPNIKRHRPSGYEWTQRDWESWRCALKAFLRSDRGRAALLRGGVVWRIAMDFIQVDTVVRGPSEIAKSGKGMVRQDGAGGFYVNNDLSQDEVDLICGVHYVYVKGTPRKEHFSSVQASSSKPAPPTSIPPISEKGVPESNAGESGSACTVSTGQPKSLNMLPSSSPPPQQQLQRVSYFPPEELWLHRYGCFNGWSEDADVMFLKNMSELRSNGYQPKAWSLWKEHLKLPGNIRHVSERLESASEIAIIHAKRPPSS